MSFIKVHMNDVSQDPIEVRIRYEFQFYHFIPYVLLSDLKEY